MSQQHEQVQEKKYPVGTSAKFAAGTLVASLPFDLLAHLGPTGFLVGGLASYVAWKHGPEVYEALRGMIPQLPPLEQALEAEPVDTSGKLMPLKSERQKQNRSFWDRAMGKFPEGYFDSPDPDEEILLNEQAPTGEPALEGDSLFAQQAVSTEVPGIRRITIEEMVKHTTRNSYEVYIGRSLTGLGYKPVKINFRKRHIKLIGASQHGKSSMAAALLEAITRTHDNEHVLLALLDLENKTSRLFANLPHVAELMVGEKVVDLHAKSYDEVLERLELICELIDYRYTLSEQELDALPILIVYLEEFIDLKDYFKQLIDAVPEDQKEAAKKKYTRLVYCIKKIAARGLKAYVQLLMCAQVDYADEDLKEALVNVTSGMSFAVRPTAAKAAGFYQNAMITQNAKDDKVGQCVVEMPDCKDIILAPDYDLKARLRALGAKQAVYKKATPVNLETPVYQRVNSLVNGSTSSMEPLPANPRLRLLETGNAPEIELEDTEEPSVNVNVNVNDQTRETIKRLVEMGTLKHRQIAKVVKLDGRNYGMYRQVCREMGIATEKEA
jgi:FtsK/SpoIIIE family